MKSIVVYESMFGSTHRIADAIAAGLAEVGPARVMAPAGADPEEIMAADLLVVGGPTHVHGVSTLRSRFAAKDLATFDPTLEFDGADSAMLGLRTWLRTLEPGDGRSAAAFDTRVDKPKILTGSAARGISRRLRKRGYHVLDDPMSFVLTDHGPISDAEVERARTWGERLGHRCHSFKPA